MAKAVKILIGLLRKAQLENYFGPQYLCNMKQLHELKNKLKLLKRRAFTHKAVKCNEIQITKC